MGVKTLYEYFYKLAYGDKGVDKATLVNNCLDIADAEIKANKDAKHTQGTDYSNIVICADYDHPDDAITAIGASNKTLLVTEAETCDTNFTVPANVTVRFERGGKWTINDGVTVTFNGQIDAGLFQIFAYTGTGILAGTPQIKEVYPQWFGAVADGTTDDRDAIRNAIIFIQNGGTIYFPAGIYAMDSGVGVTYSNLTYLFNPDAKIDVQTETSILFSFTGSDNITIIGGEVDGNDLLQIAWYFTDASNIIVKDVYVHNLDSPSNDVYSCGIDFKDTVNGLISNCRIIHVQSTTLNVGSGINVNSTAIGDQCYNIKIENCYIEDIKPVADGDGIKFLGHDIDVKSYVTNCTLIDCYKRSIKIQPDNVKVDGVKIVDTHSVGVGESIINLQGCDNVTISNVYIKTTSYHTAGIQLGTYDNQNIIIENVFMTATDNTNSINGIQTASNSDFKNIVIKNITIDGSNWSNGIVLAETTGVMENIIIDSVHSPSVALVITETNWTNIRVLNSKFSSVSGIEYYYKEGEWTMGVSFGGGTTGITYGTQIGHYTKIGRVIHINGSIILTSKGTDTGIATVTGLPFTSKSASSSFSPVALRINKITFANRIQSLVSQGSTTIGLEEITEAGTISAIYNTDFANDSSIMVSATYFTD